ncbi:uncharacterized protein MEPE_03793 [Melanopsichium pennsylvanicum]|uniref:Uncharacterized protein n=1 Tax=Melanopsichium pennsylvanicum TaxID=63383 RepID=A0AAJ4XMH9_9BASI|nr:uncharacterized protein MEPE_03793 [Melanopsichium pennsylvanicum]
MDRLFKTGFHPSFLSVPSTRRRRRRTEQEDLKKISIVLRGIRDTASFFLSPMLLGERNVDFTPDPDKKANQVLSNEFG